MSVAVPEVAAAAVGAADTGAAAAGAAATKKAVTKRPAAKKAPAKKSPGPLDPAPGTKPTGGRSAGEPAADTGKPAPGPADRYRAAKRKARGARAEVRSLTPRTLRGTGSRRALVGEFIGCSVILALSPLTDKHDKDTPADWLRRMSAVAVLFGVLGLVATAGRQASRVAAAAGGLVLLALTVSERDVFVVLAQRFDPSRPAASGVADVPGGLEDLADAAADQGYGLGYLGPITGPPASSPPVGRSRPV